MSSLGIPVASWKYVLNLVAKGIDVLATVRVSSVLSVAKSYLSLLNVGSELCALLTAEITQR